MASAQKNGITATRIIYYSDEAEGLSGLYQLFSRLACSSDLVLLGEVSKSVSHLNDYATAIYSDHDIGINQVLKDDSKAPARQHVVLTGLSGATTINGYNAHFEDQAIPILKPGLMYMIFLRYLPAARAYIAVDRFSTLELNAAGQCRFSQRCYVQSPLRNSMEVCQLWSRRQV